MTCCCHYKKPGIIITEALNICLTASWHVQVYHGKCKQCEHIVWYLNSSGWAVQAGEGAHVKASTSTGEVLEASHYSPAWLGFPQPPRLPKTYSMLCPSLTCTIYLPSLSCPQLTLEVSLEPLNPSSSMLNLSYNFFVIKALMGFDDCLRC